MSTASQSRLSHAPDCRILPGVPYYLWCTDCDPVPTGDLFGPPVHWELRNDPTPPIEWWYPQGPKAPPDRAWLETECHCCGRPEHASRWRRLIEWLRDPRCARCGARKAWDFDPVSAQCNRGGYVYVNGADDPHEWNR